MIFDNYFVVFSGQQLISVRGACPKEVVQPKCDELSRVCDMVTERLSRRLEILLKSRDLMERVEKVCQHIQSFYIRFEIRLKIKGSSLHLLPTKS